MNLKYKNALFNLLQVCDTDDVEIDVADLKLGNRYTFRVAAVNEMGQGPWLEADGDVTAKDPWGNVLLCSFSLQDPISIWSYRNIALTHCSRETRKRVLGKQCRPRSDAAERGVWSGSPLFANRSTIFLSEYLNLIAWHT